MTDNYIKIQRRVKDILIFFDSKDKVSIADALVSTWQCLSQYTKGRSRDKLVIGIWAPTEGIRFLPEIGADPDTYSVESIMTHLYDVYIHRYLDEFMPVAKLRMAKKNGRGVWS